MIAFFTHDVVKILLPDQSQLFFQGNIQLLNDLAKLHKTQQYALKAICQQRREDSKETHLVMFFQW